MFSRVPYCGKHLTHHGVNHNTLSSVQYSVFPFCLRRFRVYMAVFHLIVRRFCFTYIVHGVFVEHCIISVCVCVCVCEQSLHLR